MYTKWFFSCKILNSLTIWTNSRQLLNRTSLHCNAVLFQWKPIIIYSLINPREKEIDWTENEFFTWAASSSIWNEIDISEFSINEHFFFFFFVRWLFYVKINELTVGGTQSSDLRSTGTWKKNRWETPL